MLLTLHFYMIRFFFPRRLCALHILALGDWREKPGSTVQVIDICPLYALEIYGAILIFPFFFFFYDKINK